MLWREHEIWTANEYEVRLSLTLVRQSDLYTAIILLTSTSPWTSCHLLITTNGGGFHVECEVLIVNLDSHTLALECSGVLERMKELLMSHYSRPRFFFSEKAMRAMFAESSIGVLRIV